MSIIPGHKKYIRYVKTENGYQICSQKTYADTVVFDDGNTLKAAFDNMTINNSLTIGNRSANSILGKFSIANGDNVIASGDFSHAEGYGTITGIDCVYQHVAGKYNVEDINNTYAYIIGGGTSDNDRRNIFTVAWDGNVEANGHSLVNDTQIADFKKIIFSTTEPTIVPDDTIVFVYDV